MQTNKDNFVYLRTVVLPFLRANGDRRIGKKTFEFYKTLSIYRQSSDEIVIAEVTDEQDNLCAISIAVIHNKSHVVNSTTVTHKDLRQKGYGTAALKKKIEILKEKGMGIKSTIAEDNTAAMALCQKVSLKPIDRVSKTRSTGPYFAVIWTDPPIPSAD